MAINKDSGYALELIVGVKDAFTQQSKKIEKESNKLEREFKQLQKTTADVDAFKKAESAIEQLTEAEKQYSKILGQKKDELPKLKAELAKVTQQSRIMANEESKLQSTINKLRTDMAGLSDAGSTNTKTFKKKTGAVAQAERTLQAYQSKLKSTTQDENRIRTSISATERELGDLTKAHQKSTNEIKAHERLVSRLGNSLKEAGLDVNDIIQEEKRLQGQLNRTNKEISEQGRELGKLQHFEKLGAIAGGAMASAGFAWAGNDKSRNERLLAARSSYSLEEVQSTSQRQFRTDLIRVYGADQESIFAAQALAKQQNLGEEDTQALTKATIQLQKIFPDHSSPETVRALANISKGFGISIEEAANKVYATSSMVGDANGDLLDTFAEYSPLLGDKISFDQFAASIVRARQAGVWNTDKVGDSFKESFMARFSDSDEFAKLVGQGDKAGTIDAISDVDLRNRIKEAAYRVRSDVETGNAPGNNYAALLALVNSANKTDAATVKPVLEAIGGTILSEDIGTKGLDAMQQGLQEGGKVFDGVDSLDDAAQGVSTSIDKAKQSFNATTDTVSNSAAKLIDKFDDLGTAVSNVTGSATGAMNENSGLGYAGLVGGIGATAFGGMIAARLGKKALGKILGTAMGTQGGFKPASMFSGLFSQSAAEPVAKVAKGSSFWSSAGKKVMNGGKGVLKKLPVVGRALSATSTGLFTKSATKPVDKVAKGASSWSSAGEKVINGGKGALKKLPVIGTALNAASIGMSAIEGDTEGVWRGIGATAGTTLGGLAGSLFGGFGAVPGAIAGSVAGDEIAGWLYDIFNGKDDPVNQQAVAQVEQTVQSATMQPRNAISQPPATIEVSFAPVIQLEAVSSEADVMAQTLVAALRDMTPQLKQTLHDVMDDLWKDMDHVDLD
ncbi:Phage tail tape measure protein domain-containing protein [Vibrio crassostreae]|nr:Phage tail tape measure protein domain-containing protein [Vibrio crassostreae]CAK1783152.1 Phage tail tape measure protein domain-containing protein [Vibrio crassostreae]CAK2290500.1 Phage tail tape measure protein domain-containing protein [Vibrio crassostreae]